MLVTPKVPVLTGNLAQRLLAHFPLSEGERRSGIHVNQISVYDSRGNLRLDWSCSNAAHLHLNNDYGLYFDGIDNRAVSADSAVVSRLTNPDKQITIAAWIFTTRTGQQQYICDIGDGGTSFTSPVNYRLRIEPTSAERIRFSFTDGGNFGIVYPAATTGASVLNPGHLTHVAVTADLNRGVGDRVRIYYNSQNIKALTYSNFNGPWVSSGNIRFAIGSLASVAGSGWFQGNIQDLMIWNRWLSAHEVDQVYGLGAC